MFTYLVLLFILLPALELALLIHLGAYIGVVNTLMVIVFTGMLGAYLARLQGFSVLAKIQQEVNAGRMPTEQMIDGVLIFVGGLVLLTPGFITDTIGFLLLIPMSRNLIKTWVKKKFSTQINTAEGGYTHVSSQRNRPKDFEDADFH